MTSRIARVTARQIIDSRGNPTVEVDVELESGATGRAAVPSGASTGRFEAVELRDGDQVSYLGKGVTLAVANVVNVLAPALVGADASDQRAIDRLLADLDGTANKARLGANAILGCSLAVSRAAAANAGEPVWRWIGVEVFHHLRALLHERGLATAVGDEGGFAPDLEGTEPAIEAILEAAERAGHRDRVAIALDVAATELWHDGAYHLDGEARSLTTGELIAHFGNLCDRYPIVSIEDPLAEDEWDAWRELTERLGSRVQLVGDDLFVTNAERLQRGIEGGVANAILVKVNQIGTLTETVDAIELARSSGYAAIISHRSGETEDTTIADLAVAVNAGQIKTGAPSRTDRVAKYNQLLRIEESLGSRAAFPGADAFRRSG
jgi:enolase